MRKLKASMADMDAWWAGYAITVPGFAGSWLGFLYFGAGIWAVLSIALRRFPLRVPRQSRLFVFSCIGYATVLLVTSVTNDGLKGVVPGFAAGAAFYFVPFLLSRLVTSNPKRTLETMLQYAPLGAAMCLVVALYQVFLQSKSIEGGAGNPSVFGYVSAILSALSYKTPKSLRDFRAHVSLTGYLSGMCALLLSGTRTLYPLVVLIPVIHFFITAERLSKFRIGVVLLPLAMTGILILFFSSKIIRDVSISAEEIAQVGGEPFASSLGIRLELWKAGLASFAEAPWLGHGQIHKMDGVFARLPDIISYVRFTHAHNIFIDNALSGGILALTFLFLIMISPIISAGKIDKSNQDKYIKYYIYIIVIISLLNGMLNVLFTHDIVTVLFLFTLTNLVAGIGVNSR